MTASLPSDSGPALAPLGFIEPHALLLTQPAPGQRLFKIMKAEHLIQSIEGGYLHFNRVDAYSDFPLADAHDGAELPLDQPANQAASFEKAPSFTLSDYYAQSRGRTYTCCFSLKNSPYMWEHYGLGSATGQVGLEFDLEKLRRRLNGALSSKAALMCGDVRCRQIFSINYGEVAYVDRATCRANLDRTANPKQSRPPRLNWRSGRNGQSWRATCRQNGASRKSPKSGSRSASIEAADWGGSAWIPAPAKAWCIGPVDHIRIGESGSRKTGRALRATLMPASCSDAQRVVSSRRR
jgi:hypothetical protein